MEGLGDLANGLDGIVVPKFTAATGGPFLDEIAAAARRLSHRLWVMPVIESPEVFQLETRVSTLLGIRETLANHDAEVLAVRIGATDLSAVLGLRRHPDITVYDVQPIAGVIGDIVNVLGRRDGTGYVVTGPVWEHFDNRERIFKPQLRETPFTAQAVRVLRRNLISKGLDGLMREVALDQANGLLGKTVIHPSHVPAVHSLSVVTHEDYVDALDVLARLAAVGRSRVAVPQQDERVQPAPRLGAGDDAAGASLRCCPGGHQLRRPARSERQSVTSFVGHHAGIEVTDAGLLPGLALTDLFDLALRVNPKRPHLLVSTVLAKHVPTDPRIVRGSGLLLGLRVA